MGSASPTPVSPRMAATPEGLDALPLAIEVRGLGGPLCTVEATLTSTVRQVQEMINQKIGVPPSRQVLLQGTVTLSPEESLDNWVAPPATFLDLTLVVQQAPHGFVNFTSCCNGLVQLEPGHLVKSSGAANWNATAVSSQSFEVGGGRGFRFRPANINKSVFIGLAGQSQAGKGEWAHYAIDFAVYLGLEGRFYICERGKDTHGSERSYQVGSVIELQVTDVVQYFLDGELQYTSPLQGQEQLYVMASFHAIGAEILDIEWL